MRTLFLFAPGAGAPSSSPWMTAWTERLAQLGVVVTFDYPYMVQGRRAPDPPHKLVRAHLEALAAASKGHTGPVVLVGKSMGGRIGCHASLEARVDGLVCLGYPLKSAGARAALRDQVLLQLQTPVLFVQGTRDPLCPLDLLSDVRRRMTAKNDLLVVEGGNHSLEVTATALRAAGETAHEVNARIVDKIANFVDELRQEPRDA